MIQSYNRFTLPIFTDVKKTNGGTRLTSPVNTIRFGSDKFEPIAFKPITFKPVKVLPDNLGSLYERENFEKMGIELRIVPNEQSPANYSARIAAIRGNVDKDDSDKNKTLAITKWETTLVDGRKKATNVLLKELVKNADALMDGSRKRYVAIVLDTDCATSFMPFPDELTGKMISQLEKRGFALDGSVYRKSLLEEPVAN